VIFLKRSFKTSPSLSPACLSYPMFKKGRRHVLVVNGNRDLQFRSDWMKNPRLAAALMMNVEPRGLRIRVTPETTNSRAVQKLAQIHAIPVLFASPSYTR
jgi:hypothetical protein